MKAKTLKIAGLNFDTVWKQKAQNFAEIHKGFEQTDADVFLLPEMFATGFCMDAAEIADKENETLHWMKCFAQEKNSTVAGSAGVQEAGKYFNRFYFVTPDGGVEFYDKRHLFSYSGEDKIFTAGKERKIVECRGVRILLQVCYDLRFPVFSRNNDDYEVALYVANWPAKRIDAWNTLLKARAIENQAYVFGLNRIGTDGNHLHYPESSACYFADGAVISTSSGNIVSAELDLEKLAEFRAHFSFLQDRDDFKLGN